MIQCPKCGNTLPDWATACQFCHTDVKSVVRPKTVDDVGRYGGKLPEKTLWSIYYALSALWIINGSVTIFESLQPRKFMGEMIGPGAFDYIVAFFGLLVALVGIGLILKIEIARGVVNFLAALNILFGLLGLVGSLMAMMISGPLGFLVLLNNVISIAVSGASMWIIGETQTRAPNL